jgi:hypothetical protein
MQPPFHVTGDPNVDWVIFVVGFIVCLYWLRALRLAREGARLFLKNLLRAAIVFCALMAILTSTQQKTQLNVAQEEVIAGFVALIFFGRWQSRKRSRYISKSVRRAVIERDLKGEKFDPERHHIDHVWPLSRGGSHTVDNLRVVAKEKNLKKGAKRPRMREMW